MTGRRIETVLLDAGGVLLDLDYAFLRRLLAARHIDVPIEALSEAESIARMAIDRRVREGGRTSEAWRDYFRILLTRVGTPPGWTEGIVDTLWEAHGRVGLWTVAIDGAVAAVRALKAAGCSRRSSTRTWSASRSPIPRSSQSRSSGCRPIPPQRSSSATSRPSTWPERSRRGSSRSCSTGTASTAMPGSRGCGRSPNSRGGSKGTDQRGASALTLAASSRRPARSSSAASASYG